MFEKPNFLEQKQKTIETLSKLNIKEKISGTYLKDFKKNFLHVGTGTPYEYYGNKRKIEEIKWIFYSGRLLNKDYAVPLIVLGEYYDSGMRHDIVVLHKMSLFPLASTSETVYLYQDELDGNIQSLNEGKDFLYKNAGQFSRLNVRSIFSDMLNVTSIYERYGKVFTMDKPLDFSRTTVFFQNFLSEPYRQGLNRDITFEENKEIAKEMWNSIKKY